MLSREDAIAFCEGGYRECLPHLSVDCVIFGFHDGELKILLLKWRHTDSWSLPGGFVRREESIHEAAHRVLHERTGLDRLYLEQFRTFGGTNRGESVLRPVLQRHGLPVPEDAWFLDRVVSIGYYALVDFSGTTPTPDFFSEACDWWDIRERPPLLFDHDEMVVEALRTVRQGLSYRPVGSNLLPECFTMPELQQLYETLLGRPLDRRNFQKKILSLGVVERLTERRHGGAHRSPYLYRFHPEHYRKALADGLSIAPSAS